METRSLYALTLTCVSVVGVFYYYSGQSEKLSHTSSNGFYSSAESLYVTQTDEQGRLYVQAHLGRIEQQHINDDTFIQNIQGTLYQEGLPSVVFTATQGQADADYQKVQLSHGVDVHKLSHTQSPTLSFSTNSLQADTKTQHIFTHDAVQIHSPQASFYSQGLDANLTLGEYNFFHIRANYDPVQHP